MLLVGGVITGDIINSSRLSADEHKGCLEQIEQMISKLNNAFDAQGDVFRGDEFQIFVPNPKHALRCGVLMRLALIMNVKHADARVSIGIGEYQEIEADIRKTARGEAFELSGRSLNEMKEERFKITMTKSKELDLSRVLLVKYLDFIITGLSKKQAEVLLPRILFPGLTQEELSQKTGIKRRSLASRLQRSNASLILDTLGALETTLTGSV